MKELLKSKTAEVMEIIAPFFTVSSKAEANLKSSMEYALTSGGKRLRPMMMRESSLLFAGKSSVLPDFMAAIEMIHNYSLVHDDLPDIDNDMLRHGKPSTHAVYGAPMALLAGDGLLNLAFETAIGACLKEPGEHTVKASDIMARAAGATGMVGGQALDVQSDKGVLVPGKEELDYIYKNKTGKLISAPLMMGGVLSGADKSEVETLDRIGYLVGYAFQIVDDILDIEGDEATLGKPIGSDEKNNKPTFVTINGMEKSRQVVKEYTEEAIERLMTLPGDKSFLNDLFLYLINRNA